MQSIIHIPPPRPASFDSSPLARLPPEIIQHIASLLPPSAAASFASTCLSIRLMTGTQYLAPLRASPLEMISLLEFIVLDLNTNPTISIPSHLLCIYCRRLVPYPALCGPTSTPHCKHNSTQCQIYVPSSFRHQIFHTDMAMYRHGRSLLPLLTNIITRSTTTIRLDSDTIRQESWKYHIIQDSLYQRVRYTFIHPRSDKNHTIQVQPCPHYANYEACMNREAVNMQNLVRDRPSMRACSDMVSCQHCRTVLRVGCRKFRGLGLGLFVTCWTDLGLGDARWVEGKRGEPGWKDVRYSRKWATDYFEHMCSSQRYYTYYFDFEGMDTRADRKELLAMARSIRKG